MKNSARLFVAALSAATIFATGCTKEITGGSSAGRKISFGVTSSFNSYIGTKTSYSGEKFESDNGVLERIDWVDGDLITIYSPDSETEINAADYAITDIEEPTDVKSKAKIKENDPDEVLYWGEDYNKSFDFYSFYPAEAQNKNNISYTPTDDGIEITAKLYSSQDGTPNMNFAYMYAKSQGAPKNGSVTLDFKPMVTTFQITIGCEANDESVTLTGFSLRSGSKALVGEYTASVNSEGEVTYDVPEKEDGVNNIITINFDEEITLSGDNKAKFVIFALPIDYNDLKISFTRNDGTKRSLELRDVDNNYIEFGGTKKHNLTFNVPDETEDSMKFTIETSSDGTTFYMPFPTSAIAPATMIIDWGEEGAENTTILRKDELGEISHTYGTAGKYTITITSKQGYDTEQQIPNINTRSYPWYNDKSNSGVAKRKANAGLIKSFDTPILNAIDEGNSGSCIILGYTGVETLPENLLSKNRNLKSAVYMFSSCSSLSSLPENLFSYCKDIGLFNYTFEYCYGLTEVPENLFAENENATQFDYCFRTCTNLEAIPGGLFKNNTKATSFEATFSTCQNLKSIGEGLFDSCTEAESFNSTFYKCEYALKTIPASLFKNNAKATDFSYTFYDCTKLSEIPDGLFDGNSKAKDFSYTFNDCDGITEIPEGLFKNNKNATSFKGTFNSCGGITKIPVDLFKYNTEVTTFASTFSGCNQARCETLSGFFSTNTKAINFQETFYQCHYVGYGLSEIFIGNGMDKATRFSNISTGVNITLMFYYVGTKLAFPATDNLIDFSEYTFGENGYFYHNDKKDSMPGAPYYRTSTNKNKFANCTTLKEEKPWLFNYKETSGTTKKINDSSETGEAFK